jgi:hypothetical protein
MTMRARMSLRGRAIDQPISRRGAFFCIRSIMAVHRVIRNAEAVVAIFPFEA